LTQNQLSSDDYLAWLRGRLEPESERWECDPETAARMAELSVTPMDIFHALRTAVHASCEYDGGCFVVQGKDLDERELEIVVAPPSAKNRVRVVKFWINS
jgi:hypothetical protein